MRQEFIQLSNLYIKNEYQERLNNLNIILVEGKTYLLWGHDNTPRIFANVFRGDSEILSGSIYINGKKISKCSRQIFEQGGIFCVDSHVELMSSFTLAENLFLLKNNSLKKIRLNQKALLTRTRELLKKYDLKLDAGEKVENLRAIEKIWFQMIRFADLKAKMVVLSGITQICSREDMEKLLKLMRKFKEEKISFLIFDSHPEFFWNLADDFYLMRGGHLIRKFWDKARFNRCWNSLMRENGEAGPEIDSRKEQNDFLMRFIWKNRKEQEVFLKFKQAEIIYIKTTGWEQQQEIRRNLLGENGHHSVFECGDQRLIYDDVKILVKNRIGFWGEEPLKAEYFSNLSVRENILIPSMKRISRCGFYQRGERFVYHDRDFCPELEEIEKSYGLTDDSVFKIIGYRWKLFNPRVLIVHNILSRADLNMRKWISGMIFDMKKRGTAVILLEAFEEDALLLADRVVLPESQWI